VHDGYKPRCPADDPASRKDHYLGGDMSDAPILGPVNAITDVEAADDFQKKHTPYVETQRTGETVKVTVKVGFYVAHPNQPDHFIEWIALFAGDSPIARFDLSPVAVDPEVTAVIRVDPGTVITAMEHCNLHGLWTAKVTV
jgi:superoxide reductase